MLRALVYKEIREHRLIAAGMLLLGAVVALARARYYPDRMWQDVPLRDANLQGTFFVAAIAWGAVVGVLQSLLEESRGTWRFLLQRPAGGGRLLLAKLLGGVILHAAPLLLPLALLTALSSQEGRFPAPFDAWDVLPFLGALACSSVAYAGTFAAGLCRGGWSARFFVFVGGVLLSVLALGQRAYSPLESCALLALGLGLSIAAARGAFHGSRARLATALLVGTGAALLLHIALDTARSMGEQPEQPQWMGYPVFARQDGTPRLAGSVDGKQVLRDLSGSLVAADVRQDDPRLGSGAPVGSVPPSASWRDPAVQFMQPYERPAPRVYWYLDQRHGVFVGYDPQTALAVMCIGPDGPRAAGAQGRRFTGALGLMHWRRESGGERLRLEKYLATDDGVYLVDLGDRPSARRIYDAAVDSLGISTHADPALVIRSGDRVCFMGLEGGDERWVRIPPEAGLYFSIYRIGADHFGIVEGLSSRDVAGGASGEYETVARLLRMDAAANVEWRTEVVVVRWRYRMPLEEALFYASMLPAAIAAHFLLRGRGLSRARRAAWTAFALAGGLPALIALRLVVADEARIACPSCGKARAPSAPRCDACGGGWPPPERRPVDLFAEEVAPTEAAGARG